MIDINAKDFVETFDLSKATVGVVGNGYVGKACSEFFKDGCRVLVYDKFDPSLSPLTDLVKEAEVIFVAVPTPMKNDGSCYTGIVESVLVDILAAAKEVGRDPDGFVVVLKSTVTPGFTESMQFKYHELRIVFSPEFLTEANSIKDFQTTNRVVLGGEIEDARVVYKFFEGKQPLRVQNGQLTIVQCSPTVAEMAKLYTNGLLMTKVLFSNEIYQICEKLKIPYEEVRIVALLDRRLGLSHTLVPGPDGDLGAGGHCFPKDLNNLRAFAKELGVPEKLFTAVLERNDELRTKKDWLEMKGRAVIDE